MNTSTVAGRYQDDISRYPAQLTPEQEQALGVRIKQGDRDARNELATGNLRFVLDIAKRYKHCGVPAEDVVAWGNVGLLKAAEKFDPDRGVRFITYAVWWILQSIKAAISVESRTVQLPNNVTDDHTLISRTRAQLQQALSREPTDAEVADGCGMDGERYRAIAATMRHTTSLDDPGPVEQHNVVGSGLGLLERVMYDDSAVDPMDIVDREKQAERALQCLTPQEREAVEMRHGLNGYQGRRHVYAEIGMTLGYSKQRAQQVLDKAMRKMRHPQVLKHLAS